MTDMMDILNDFENADKEKCTQWLQLRVPLWNNGKMKSMKWKKIQGSVRLWLKWHYDDKNSNCSEKSKQPWKTNITQHCWK
jgi:hypothetical protein